MQPQKITILNKKKQKIVGEFYERSSKSLIIVCHGLENINNFLDERLQQVFKDYFVTLSNRSNASIFSFDFRGHGASDGEKRISLRERSEDIANVVDYFHSRFPDIILYGYSLGAMSVAIEAAKDARVKKLILINGFLSFDFKLMNATQLKNILLYTLFHPQFVLEIFYWVEQFRIKDIKIPTLILCGKTDSVVGSVQSKYFYNKLLSKKKLVLLPTSDHTLLAEVDNLPRIIGRWVREQKT